MGDLSKHFSRREFRCNCGCGKDTVDAALVAVLERVRAHFDRPVTISSGNRCRDYNRRCGGAEKSQHLLSKAADIKVSGVSPAEVYEWLAETHPGGLGKYHTFTHIDVRDGAIRWSGH